MSFLDWGPLGRIRRNHALEHASLQVLVKRNPHLRAAGYSDAGGFWIVGDVPSEVLAAAVNEALARLEGGERGLAIHPNCGTNYAAAGLLAGTAAWLATLNTSGDWRQRLDRWPMLITLVTLAFILAQPFGPLLQARVTTDGRPNGLTVTSIQRRSDGKLPIHRILTKS